MTVLHVSLYEFGLPKPWSVDELQVYLAKLRKDIERKSVHAYYLKRRIWAQKLAIEKNERDRKTRCFGTLWRILAQHRHFHSYFPYISSLTFVGGGQHNRFDC